MKRRSEILEARRAILLASTVFIAIAPVAGARAADAPAVVAAPADVVGWYFNGGLEAGGRFYLERPPSGFARDPVTGQFLTMQQTKSIASFWRYGEIREAPFLDWMNLNWGTKDGRYAFDFWARHVGQDNQSYNLDAAAVGTAYLSLGWDEWPYVISTSAHSVFTGAGGTNLNVDPALRTFLQQNLVCANTNAFPTPSPAFCTGANAGATTRSRIEAAVNNAALPLELGTKRERASAAARWTPTEEWDVRVDYTHEDRTGTRPFSLPFGVATFSQATAGGAITAPNPTTVAALRPQGPTVEVPAPIDDRTQNVVASGEWAGTAFWGTKTSLKVGYSGSFYDQNAKFFDVQNPFCITCTLTGPVAAFNAANLGAANTIVGPNTLRGIMWPSNDANAVTVSASTDVPTWRTRIASTFQYNVMRQNDAFIRSAAEVYGGVPFDTWPAGSANAEIRAMNWYTQISTKFSDNVWNTLKIRIYDFDNRTPELTGWIPYIWGDVGPNAIGPIAPLNNRTNLAISYHRDRVEDDVKWRTPLQGLTLGVGGGWERWDRDRRDVNVTNEWFGKVFADWNVTDWLLWRGSLLGAERRFNEYNVEVFVEEIGGIGNFSEVASNMRRYDMANRDRIKGETALQIAVNRMVTITPTAGIRWDDYPTSVEDQLGIRSDHSWFAGADIGVLLGPTLRLNVGYTYEDRKLNMLSGAGAGGTTIADCSSNTAINPEAAFGIGCTWGNNAHQTYHTLLTAVDWKAIPSTLDFRFEYVYSRGEEANTFIPCPAPSVVGVGAAATAVGTNCNGLQSLGTGATLTIIDPTGTAGQFPAEHNTLQRFNAIGVYHVDPSFVRSMGWWGDVALKVRYTYETNKVFNWQHDNLTPYVPTGDNNELTGGGRALFLAWNNPNYTAQLIAASLVVKW